MKASLILRSASTVLAFQKNKYLLFAKGCQMVHLMRTDYRQFIENNLPDGSL